MADLLCYYIVGNWGRFRDQYVFLLRAQVCATYDCRCLSWVLGESRCKQESTGVCMYGLCVRKDPSVRNKELDS